jgi:hypothetical protein
MTLHFCLAFDVTSLSCGPFDATAACCCYLDDPLSGGFGSRSTNSTSPTIHDKKP